MGKRRRMTAAEEAAIAFGEEPESGTAEVAAEGSESGTEPEGTLRVKSTAPSLALVPPGEVVSSAEILASKVRTLRMLLETSAANYARACEVAAEIKERHWQQTKDEDGKQYLSWTDYARRALAPALGLKSPSAIYGMIKVVDEGLVPDVHAFGSTVARALASLPEARRPEVRALAVEGAPTDEIKARTTAILDEEHARQASEAESSGEAPRKRMGRPVGSGKSKRKREEESRTAAVATSEHALSELASTGRSAFTFCFEAAEDGTIVDTFAVYGTKEVDQEKSIAKDERAKGILVDHGHRLVEGVRGVYFVLQDRNGRRLEVEIDCEDGSEFRVKAEKPTEDDDADGGEA